MIKIEKDKIDKCDPFFTQIKSTPSQWTLISIRLSNIHTSPPDKIQRTLLEYFCEEEGFSVITNDHRILLVINELNEEHYPVIKQNITQHLNGNKHRIIIQRFTPAILNTLNKHICAISTIPEVSLYNKREKRSDNIILIADDDTFIRTVLKKLLSKHADIYEAENSDDVITAYEEYNPDIIILDIHMPEKNGIDLIKDLFEIDPEPFIIITSADSVKENVIRSISHGAAGFLSKPIQSERLYRLVAQCLTHQNLKSNYSPLSLSSSSL